MNTSITIRHGKRLIFLRFEIFENVSDLRHQKVKQNASLPDDIFRLKYINPPRPFHRVLISKLLKPLLKSLDLVVDPI